MRMVTEERESAPDYEDSGVFNELVGFPALLELNLASNSITQVNLAVQKLGYCW
jgi:hypothetical protein